MFTIFINKMFINQCMFMIVISWSAAESVVLLNCHILSYMPEIVIGYVFWVNVMIAYVHI